MNHLQHSSRCHIGMIALWAGLFLSCAVGPTRRNLLPLSPLPSSYRPALSLNAFHAPALHTPLSPAISPVSAGLSQAPLIANCHPTGWIDRIEGDCVILLAPHSPPQVLLRRCLDDPLREGDFLWRGRPRPQHRRQMANTIHRLLQQRPPTPRLLLIP